MCEIKTGLQSSSGRKLTSDWSAKSCTFECLVFGIKIRLIRPKLDFLFLYLNTQPPDHMSGVITVTRESAVSGRHRKASTIL